MYIDYTYIILVLPAVLFALWANANVNSTYKKYKNQYNIRGLTGAEAAKKVLESNGIYNVGITVTSGELTDHFDPKDNVIRLSSEVYSGSSSAAVGIACHEAGHAVQHAENYLPAKIRMTIVPITNFASRLSMPLIIIGLLLSAMSARFITLAYFGVACFALSTVFQLVTLPTEFNASNRAVKCIENNCLLSGEEIKGTKKVLRAAALTYVAALAVSVMQLLRLLIIVGGRRRD